MALGDSLASGCGTTLPEGSSKSLTRGSSGTGAEAVAGAEEGGSQWIACLFPSLFLSSSMVRVKK